MDRQHAYKQTGCKKITVLLTIGIGLAQAHPKNIDGYDTIYYNSTKHVEFAHEAMVQ